MSFNFFDIVCAILLVIAIIRGLSKGLLHEALSFVGYFMGAWIALAYSDSTSTFFIEKLELGEKYSHFIAFILIFIGVILLFRFVGFLLTKLASALALGIVNRLLGMVFCIGKSALILSILLNICRYFDSSEKYISKEYKEASVCYIPVESMAPQVFEWLGLEL